MGREVLSGWLFKASHGFSWKGGTNCKSSSEAGRNKLPPLGVSPALEETTKAPLPLPSFSFPNLHEEPLRLISSLEGHTLAGEEAETLSERVLGGGTTGEQSSGGARELESSTSFFPPAAGGGARPPNHLRKAHLPPVNRSEVVARVIASQKVAVEEGRRDITQKEQACSGFRYGFSVKEFCVLQRLLHSIAKMRLYSQRYVTDIPTQRYINDTIDTCIPSQREVPNEVYRNLDTVGEDDKWWEVNYPLFLRSAIICKIC
ncbi:hypothetical protein KSP40_PGU012401 [Platanthera guangdongensis]|uniref:Uncharacterized protein n=1 Tax=Platanthera guangdongensis TaxID=2320717 RepID=A0ABR2MIC0_9ASPA